MVVNPACGNFNKDYFLLLHFGDRSGKDVWPFYCCDPGWSVFNNVSRDTFLRKQHMG